jgi:hypothetical protein|tara:strand:+ start:457 stop:789 length:333 start_codon:yes stop_codon:yes gene_type:complete
MRKPKSPLRRKLLEMDALYNHYCPRRPIERMQGMALVPPSRFRGFKWLKPYKFFGSSCDYFGLTQTCKYVGFCREEGAFVYRVYKKHFGVEGRLELLQIACNRVSDLYNK